MHETGQEVAKSGVYRVVHREHRLPSEVVLIAGNKFPRCGKCSRSVKFEFERAAPSYVSRTNVIVHELSARQRDEQEDDLGGGSMAA